MPEKTLTSLDRMQSAIQLAGFHYIACLKATPTNEDHRVTIETAEYVFDAIRKTDSVSLHAEFQSWAASVVLRDLIESFSVFLMETYRAAIQTKPGIYSSTADQFERKGIEDQLAILSRDFAVDPAWVSRLVGYNRARNCLAHRQGLVGQRDVNDGANLVVSWLIAKVEPKSGVPTPYIEATGPMSSLIRGNHIHGHAVHRNRCPAPTLFCPS